MVHLIYTDIYINLHNLSYTDIFISFDASIYLDIYINILHLIHTDIYLHYAIICHLRRHLHEYSTSHPHQFQLVTLYTDIGIITYYDNTHSWWLSFLRNDK